MIFANATYLWGLLGLLIPIAIHLWSRKKVKTIKVGSIKLLEASEPKQTSSIKLNEWWLLFLRLLTILLLVFILVEPSIKRTEKNDTINYLVEASLLNDERMSPILDTIPKESVRILEKGFPKWDDYDFEKTQETPFYWQLSHQMQTIAADSIVVFSQGFAKSLKGKRPEIKANMRWITIQSDKSVQKTIETTNKESYAEVLSIFSSSTMLSFKKDSISFDGDLMEINAKRDSVRLVASDSNDWLALKTNTPIRIGIFKNDSLRNQIQFFRAAYRGISRFLKRPLKFEIFSDINKIGAFDTAILFDDTISQETDATLLVYQLNPYAEQLITGGPTQNVYYLTKLLDSENIVSEHLPERLLELLNLNKELENAINSNDLRTVAENELQPLKAKVKLIKNTASIIKTNSWLWLLLILVVVLERILSKLRRQ